LLDLGCGQGRNAIPIAQLGYKVKAIDLSKVGIQQLKDKSVQENLDIECLVGDIYSIKEFNNFDLFLMYSMFHFLKNDVQKETDLIRRILTSADRQCNIIFCTQDSRTKIQLLNDVIKSEINPGELIDISFKYFFKCAQENHQSESLYRMIIVCK
jgi:2-polyprenyl-3-methyl-5-hydroxy-6-metoxy-1,4-benzoquinol methylase